MTAAAPARPAEIAVEDLEVGAYTIPTDGPEADGTLSWSQTTLVVVHARAGGERGLGYTYADLATARLVSSKLSSVVAGVDALAPNGAWKAMVGAIRNLGRPGISSMAIAAVDLALWDLKARLLGLPLCRLLGVVRDGVPVYGSGGFTSYDRGRLQTQLADWVNRGIPRVKMKVGSRPEDDPQRVRCAREAIGPDTALFVDANGAYSGKQALELAERLRSERRTSTTTSGSSTVCSTAFPSPTGVRCSPISAGPGTGSSSSAPMRSGMRPRRTASRPARWWGNVSRLAEPSGAQADRRASSAPAAPAAIAVAPASVPVRCRLSQACWLRPWAWSVKIPCAPSSWSPSTDA